MIIESKQDIAVLKEQMKDNFCRSVEHFKEMINRNCGEESILSIKFDKTVWDPITGQPSNFIEMINQYYSNMVVAIAAERIIELFPEQRLQLNTGAKTGFDIVSLDNTIACECFSVVKVTSNQKMKKDSEKLLNADSQYRFIFFYSREDTTASVERITKKYPDIRYYRVTDFDSSTVIAI